VRLDCRELPRRYLLDLALECSETQHETLTTYCELCLTIETSKHGAWNLTFAQEGELAGCSII